MLVKVSSEANNNKFYEVQLDGAGVVHKRWGRVGTDGQSGREATGQVGFDRLVAAKTRKGYKEVKVVGAAKAGAPALDKDKIGEISHLALAADPDDTFVAPLIDRLVEKNRHEIVKASGGLIEISASGVIQTALGIIEPASLQQARRLLDQLEATSSRGVRYKAKLEEFLSLVPQKLPARRGWEAGFFDEHPFAEQRQLLTQLEQSYDWYEAERQAREDAGSGEDEVDYSDYFRYRLRTLDRSPQGTAEFKRIAQLFATSRNRHHRQVHGMRLHRVYVLEAHGGDSAFNDVAARIGNVQQLWHGTQIANVLSILRQGLYVPPITGSTIQTTGRMFGDGVYFSNQSTKSLNYSRGYWAGTRETDCFMFLADVACGREFHPRHHGDFRKAYKGHDCIYVNPGTANVLNNEVIVWDTDQIRLGYLCEFR